MKKLDIFFVQDIETSLRDHTLEKKTALCQLGQDLMANSIMTDVIKKELEDHSNQWNSLDFQVIIFIILQISLDCYILKWHYI